jgi:hypothetical protein
MCVSQLTKVQDRTVQTPIVRDFIDFLSEVALCSRIGNSPPQSFALQDQILGSDAVNRYSFRPSAAADSKAISDFLNGAVPTRGDIALDTEACTHLLTAVSDPKLAALTAAHAQHTHDQLEANLLRYSMLLSLLRHQPEVLSNITAWCSLTAT